MKEFSRYERQSVLRQIGAAGQKKLSESRVAVIGLGALGSVSASLLARAGVGNLLVIDRDFLELNNLQRQVLFDEQDLAENLPKAVVAERRLRLINSEIKVHGEVADINLLTIDGLLGDVDLVVDGTDNFETRFLINDYCLKKKIPWIYGGALGTEGMSYVILPGQGPCLRCIFGEAPNPEHVQTCDQIGILAPVSHLVASFQVMEAIKILIGKLDAVERGLWKMDLWSREFKNISMKHLEKAPCSGCAEKDYPYLTKAMSSYAASLCGRNAVQIHNPRVGKLDLQVLAARLRDQMEATANEYLLRCKPGPYEITVFNNGRAIIRGTEDVGQARSLYAKYIGN